MAIGLTRRQADALRFICGFVEAHGRAPNCDEIARGIGAAHRSGAHRLLTELEQRGWIGRKANARRSIVVLKSIALPRSTDGEPLRFIPVLSYGEEAHG